MHEYLVYNIRYDTDMSPRRNACIGDSDMTVSLEDNQVLKGISRKSRQGISGQSSPAIHRVQLISCLL